MPDQASEILSKLKDTKWREDLKARVNSVITYCEPIYYGEIHSDFLEYAKGDWNESFFEAQNIENSSLDRPFNEFVADLPLPKVICARELHEAFERYLGVPPTRDFDGIFEKFLGYVEHELLGFRQSEPVEICGIDDSDSSNMANREQWVQGLLTGYELGKAELLGNEPQLPASSQQKEGDGNDSSGPILWSMNGIEFASHSREIHIRSTNLSDTEASTSRVESQRYVLRGRISRGAESRVLNEMLPIVRSCIRSVQLIEPQSSRHTGTRQQLCLSKEQLRSVALFVRKCSALVYLPGSSRDKFERRLSIAIRLLSEADTQSNESIRLALCVAALEALLGTKGAELGRTLSDRIAALLEPDLSNRAAAFDFVKRLYTLRSEVLHGTAMESQTQEADRARKLAAGVLYGVWFRRDFHQNINAEATVKATLTPDEFL